MAQSYNSDSGTFYIPGAYPTYRVEPANSGLAANGVLMLVGEADQGPQYSQETDITEAYFSSDDKARVVAKYGSGPLVDAYINACAPANDINITGAPSSIYLIKTNLSTKATSTMGRTGLSAYGTLADKSYGKLGNGLYYSVTDGVNVASSEGQREVSPSTGTFAYVGPGNSSGSQMSYRVNGGAVVTYNIAQHATPATFVGNYTSSYSGLCLKTDVLATGGEAVGVLTSVDTGATLALDVVSGNQVVITCSASWTTNPSVGDLLYIPLSGMYDAGEDSCIKGASGGPSNKNIGAYVITGVTNTTISATKFRDLEEASPGVAPACTAPGTATAAAIGSNKFNIVVFTPPCIQEMSGVARNCVSSAMAAGSATKLTGTATDKTLVVTLSESPAVWAYQPQVGDLAYMPVGAPSNFRASGANGGWYRVTASTTTTATLLRLSNGLPSSFIATYFAATTDLQFFRPQKDGVGKSLEIFSSGTENLSYILWEADGSAAADWISSTASPNVITSSYEYAPALNVSRQSDSASEIHEAGGEVVLTIGYTGTTATLTISGTTLTTTVVGGSGSNLSIDLKQYKTIADLAQYINNLTGYKCSASSSLYGQSPVTYSNVANGVTTQYSVLDSVSAVGICTTNEGAKPGRIKRDAYSFFKQLSESALVQLGNPYAAPALSGLPDTIAYATLSSGSKGGTTAAYVAGAIDICERLRGNFLVPLFSRDAADDIADGLTEATSTYAIDTVNAYAKSHVLKMSQRKRRRNRQAFVSKKCSFSDAKLASQDMASPRVTMVFQDSKNFDSSGNLVQFQPYMLAVQAAAMQAAGFYRSLLFKLINVSGVLVADGSFSDAHDPDLEEAIKNGLMVAQKVETGGYRWNSDQTTYGADGNFVWNSTQAVYDADLVALSSGQRMEQAFVGQSLADVSAGLALSYLKGIMVDLKRLKLLAASDDAPLGYRNASIRISGNVMEVQCEIKLATAIVFIPISFSITQVQQSAS